MDKRYGIIICNLEKENVELFGVKGKKVATFTFLEKEIDEEHFRTWIKSSVKQLNNLPTND